jgi:hypothetical protein
MASNQILRGPAFHDKHNAIHRNPPIKNFRMSAGQPEQSLPAQLLKGKLLFGRRVSKMRKRHRTIWLFRRKGHPQARLVSR